MFILSLHYPPNLVDYFAGLFPFITFDAVPTDDLYNYIFDYENIDDEGLNELFENVGYEFTTTVGNMGSMFLFMLITPVMTLFHFAVLRFCKEKPPCTSLKRSCRTRSQNYVDSLFWNGTIGSIDAGYIVLSLIAMLQVYFPRLGPEYTAAENFFTVLGILILIVNCLFPLAIALLYIVKLKSTKPLPDLTPGLSDKDLEITYHTTDLDYIKTQIYKESDHKQFMEKYGILLEEVNQKKLGKTLSILTVLFTILRKFSISIGVLVLQGYPSFSIFLFNFTSLFMMMWIIYLEPYKNKGYQRMIVG